MNGFQKKFFVNYHTFLHKSLATPVFMRSLTMYDGPKIIHESYINPTFLVFSPLSSLSIQYILSKNDLAQDGSRQWATDAQAVGKGCPGRCTNFGQPRSFQVTASKLGKNRVYAIRHHHSPSVFSGNMLMY